MFELKKKKNKAGWGTWVAGSVKRLTLGFGSGHDLTIGGFEPRVGLHADSSALIAWSLLGILSLPLCRPFPRSLSLSLKINKMKLK